MKNLNFLVKKNQQKDEDIRLKAIQSCKLDKAFRSNPRKTKYIFPKI